MKEVLKKIAQENKISVDEVKSEIKKAIKQADKNMTPEGREFSTIIFNFTLKKHLPKQVLFCYGNLNSWGDTYQPSSLTSTK